MEVDALCLFHFIPYEILQYMYIELNDIVNRNRWSNCIKNNIDSLGYSHIFNNVDCNKNYLPLLKRRMRDHFIQEWHTVIVSSPKLDYYAKFKEIFCYEDYLDKCRNEKFRKSFSRLRLSSHSLEIETGRFNGIDRMNRLCKLCNQNVVLLTLFDLSYACIPARYQ